ncbi:cellulose biosynthesis cyclic di-GMP-binding regulatory protein BcsB [Ancylobacter terrae]|uniref:cellulose biosynthesis cyclic di-GMP-binding regulatory protein BcsB n=1 Tax=Ancylobacter sp. sgz301288 TaxID=3342077 RepID=UPI00385D4028
MALDPRRWVAGIALLALLPAAAPSPAWAQAPAFDMNAPANGATPAPPAAAQPFGMGAPAPGPALPPGTPPALANPPGAASPAPFGMGAPAPAAQNPAPPASGPAPFSMGASPASPSPAAPSAPFGMGAPSPGPALPPGTPPALANPPAATPAPAAAAASGPGREPLPDRLLVPDRRLVLEGEVDSRAWSIHLTREEAARQATLWVSYLNAVVVMPEVSRLRVMINGQAALETPIASSQAPARISAPLRAGLLRAGPNLIRFEVLQRHRTDCSVSSTYELWTEINTAATGLSFAGGRPPLAGGLDDLPAIGVDALGQTVLRVITPGPLEGGGSARVLRAVQAIALRGQYANPLVVLVENPAAAPAGRAPGTLTVVLGTAGELPRLMAAPPPEAGLRAAALLIDDARSGGPTLVLSGPGANDVDAAIERLGALARPPADSVATASWMAPDTPLFTGARRIRLANVGVATQEFSGRRLRTRFAIALPDDFYANYYGEGSLFLDAAYTEAVRPGSHVDLYVNDQIASTTAITNSGGGLMQRHRITFPLRNFRPGVNQLWLEVVLDTEADSRCLPGATLPGADRFVLFDSTEFALDDFARIGRRPDLAALAASAFPYPRDRNPLAVVLARHDGPTVSAAATLMARLALQAEAAIPIDSSPASATLGERPAIFVGAISQTAPGVLGQLGIAENTRVNWPAGPADEGAPRPPGAAATYDDVLQRLRERQKNAPAAGRDGEGGDTGEVYQRWRESLSGGGGITGLMDGFENWLKRTFDISYSSLRIGAAVETQFEPPTRTSVMMAQGSNPSGNGAWTLVAGRSAQALSEGLGRLTMNQPWNRIGGAITTFQISTDRIEQRAPASYRFVVTTPLGFSNFRLIAANWLSINILPYALMLVVCGTLLGISTSFLLRRLGRKS